MKYTYRVYDRSSGELDAVKRMMEEGQTVGNDPELAARAERLRERLEGKA